jgi:hypothetical protein
VVTDREGEPGVLRVGDELLDVSVADVSLLTVSTAVGRGPRAAAVAPNALFAVGDKV